MVIVSLFQGDNITHFNSNITQAYKSILKRTNNYYTHMEKIQFFIPEENLKVIKNDGMKNGRDLPSELRFVIETYIRNMESVNS